MPCHPDALAMAYALKIGASVHPLTGLIDPQILIEGGRNTIVFEQDDSVRDGIFNLFATNHSPSSSVQALRDLLCCLPTIAAPADLGYANLFRVLIVQFIDAHAFDVRSVKKSCIHIGVPTGSSSVRHLQPVLPRRARIRGPGAAQGRFSAVTMSIAGAAVRQGNGGGSRGGGGGGARGERGAAGLCGRWQGRRHG